MADKNVQGIVAHQGYTSWKNPEIKVATYDFSVDGGATSDDYMLLAAEQGTWVRLIGIDIETTFTSSGSATAIVGVDGVGSENQFLTSTAVAALIQGGVAPTSAIAQPVSPGGKVLMRFGTAAMTAGKAHFIFEVYSPDLY